MKLLVMGGTLFLGRHIIEAAIAHGHAVTSFNRGLQNPSLFPDIEKRFGNRDNDLASLHGRHFDAVIDTSAYTPSHIESVLQSLGNLPDHYTFISSISAYRAYPPGIPYSEDAPLAAGTDGYGALKARAEAALSVAMPGRVAIVRPGLIVGPHDPTDRFTYWVRRLDLGGQVAAPGRRERPIQFVDARDLADWAIHLAEMQLQGTFNAVGPEKPLAMETFLETCKAAIGKPADLHWIPDHQLAAAQIEGWTELPLWLPEDDAEAGGIFLADNQRAVQNGLKFRSIADTVTATLTWWHSEGSRNVSSLAVSTLTAEKERQLLQL